MQFTSEFVNTIYTAGCVVCVCRTSARAVKLGKAVLAFLVRINIAKLELLKYFRIRHAVINVAELEFVIAYKLMAGK